MSQLLNQHNNLIANLRKRDEIIQKSLTLIDEHFGRHCHTINGNTSDIQQLHKDQVAMVTRMVGWEEKVCHCGEGSNCLSNLSYGEPVKMLSSGPSFHGNVSPIPIPVPALASPIPGTDIGLPSSSESSSDKENSTPMAQQSVVTELVAIVEEEHLDIGGKSGHVMARRVHDELVHSVLGQKCCSKARPSHRDC